MTRTLAPLPHPDFDPDLLPTAAELARADREPPLPTASRIGHRVVTRYVAPPEPIVHLAFDGTTTLCGQPFEFRVVRSPLPTCGDCVKAVQP